MHQRICFVMLLLFVVLNVRPLAPPDDRGFDPSGVWMGQHGPLALMRAGDTLSFSYSGRVRRDRATCATASAWPASSATPPWEYVDEQGNGHLYHRGRPGDHARRATASPRSAAPTGPARPSSADSLEAAFPLHGASSRKAHFFVVGVLPSDRRPGFVVTGRLGRGDRPGQRVVGRPGCSPASWARITTAGLSNAMRSAAMRSDPRGR
ncbi:MAG: hypothetical protein MZV70_49425 [Desulfobacterales bacterium]|nr:hypothetical protein [Desulfobacterales bacterium]